MVVSILYSWSCVEVGLPLLLCHDEEEASGCWEGLGGGQEPTPPPSDQMKNYQCIESQQNQIKYPLPPFATHILNRLDVRIHLEASKIYHTYTKN